MKRERKNPDRHRTGIKGVLARPSVELRDQARTALDGAGWTMNEFLVACLSLLARDPGGLLARLEDHRPEPKPPGRPKLRP